MTMHPYDSTPTDNFAYIIGRRRIRAAAEKSLRRSWEEFDRRNRRDGRILAWVFLAVCIVTGIACLGGVLR